MPYRNSLQLGMVRYVRLPGEEILNEVDVRTLKAEAGIQLILDSEEQLKQLWDVPYRHYNLREGDKLSVLSQRYDISISSLISFNSIDDLKQLVPGKTLLIPEAEGILYTVKPDESWSDIIDHFDPPMGQFVHYNPMVALENGELQVIEGQELFLPGQKLDEQDIRSRTGRHFLMPVNGRIERSYGIQRDQMTQIESLHNGIDIEGKEGDSVYASFNGVVISAGFNNSYGNFIVLDHQNGIKTLYAHLNDISVKRNDKVLQGEAIGTVGTTGYAPKAHLHFSVFKGKKSVDPMDYLH